ncbi:hypothetical protein L6278_02680 [Candidatus Parcubacteria bacterium]|nr:hypothetical protein [Patescibacteria group bacterium]MBU4482048.1 hypothetical protein [Patescibacteria group bacterium]MCG2687020.1 hypothetical protein [Candidatus Parcubacteria bacterium]
MDYLPPPLASSGVKEQAHMTNEKSIPSTRDRSASDIKKMYAENVEQDILNEVAEATSEPTLARKKKKSKGHKIFITLLVIVILVFVVLFVISKVTNWDILNVSKNPVVNIEKDVVKASDWQAVFLTNGQVYFGKLEDVNGSYPTLEDVYYLQVQDVPIQPAEPATDEAGVQPAVETQQQMILVKFGTELHRPMDKMYLNKDHIMFFEDLRADSNVVAAIENYKNPAPAETAE